MITEDYVSLEIAKLLKEKGFDWEWSPFYSKQDRDEWFRNNNYNIPNLNYDASIPFDSEVLNVIAPHVSLQMAMKWLREEKKICIEININFNRDGDKRWYYEYGFCIFQLSGAFKKLAECDYDGYKTHEEACETAIKYVLEHLI